MHTLIVSRSQKLSHKRTVMRSTRETALPVRGNTLRRMYTPTKQPAQNINEHTRKAMINALVRGSSPSMAVVDQKQTARWIAKNYDRLVRPIVALVALRVVSDFESCCKQ